MVGVSGTRYPCSQQKLYEGHRLDFDAVLTLPGQTVTLWQGGAIAFSFRIFAGKYKKFQARMKKV